MIRRTKKVLVILVLIVIGLPAYVFWPPTIDPVTFPDGKRFAFTIVDDTDMATLEEIQPVYELLHENGLRTTKTVWVLESRDIDHTPNQGDSLRDSDYRHFILSLQDKGFEIALHNVRGGSSVREEILEGLDEFESILGHYPVLQINHSLNRDNLYWGRDRFTIGPLRWMYSQVSPREYSGQDPGSDRFWGDKVAEHVRYVRRFTFTDINLRKTNPGFPYHLAETPYVNYWFPTANGNNAEQFVRLISKENLERLEREGGVCIVYTHLGGGSFFQDGRVDPKFARRIEDLASRDGWFVPASELLDYLREQPHWNPELTFREKLRLEAIFLLERVFRAPK